MSAPVFLAERSLDAYEPGSTYLLDGVEGRHAGVVQRRRTGERIDVVDGVGARLACVIERVEGTEVTLRVEVVTRDPAPSVEIVLVQALAKGDRDELAIEAATEVGVDGVVPWQAERSVVVWRGDRAAKSRARWVATVRAAAKQSRRARIPFVGEPVDTRALARLVAEETSAGGRALLLHEEARHGIAAATETFAAAPGSQGTGTPRVLLVVGPEGGIGDQEVGLLTRAGAVPVRLGPHVLRTSTAGPVATAIVAERLGRWEVDRLGP